MDIRFIERLIELMERSSLAELDYSEGGERIRLLKTAGGIVALPAGRDIPARVQADLPAAYDPVRLIAAEAGATVPPRNLFVAAGIVGTFFRAASPGEPPLVEVGDTVDAGQTLALIEAMKTFNAVEAEQAGEIVAILAEDGAAVEPGTLLFEIAVEPGGDRP